MLQTRVVQRESYRKIGYEAKEMVSLKLQTDRRNQKVRNIGVVLGKNKIRDEKCQDYKRGSLPTPNPL
jgi:hypothetical protein